MKVNKLVAHRGDNTHYPENSLASIESALKAGALNIEFDIQMNADGSLIALHDSDFRRTSNNHSSVFTTTDAELKKSVYMNRNAFLTSICLPLFLP